MLERGEHAGVVGLADDPAGPQDESDAAHGLEHGRRTTVEDRVLCPLSFLGQPGDATRAPVGRCYDTVIFVSMPWLRCPSTGQYTS